MSWATVGVWAPLAVLCLLSSRPPAGGGPPAVPADTATFADAATRDRVLRARARRGGPGPALASFETLARDRWSAYLELPLSRVLAYRRETAARLRWRRDGPGTVEVLGSRRFQPTLGGPEVTSVTDAAEESLDVVFDPERSESFVGLGSYRFGPHPLEAGGEALYRFSLGDTVRLTLPDGRSVVLVEVRVEPRSVEARLQGSLWIDQASDRVVREGYRFVDGAAGSSFTLEAPLLGGVTMDLESLAVDYGLWEGSVWMPRLLALDSSLGLGRLGRIQVEYRRTYTDYRLEASGSRAGRPAPPSEAPPEEWNVLLPPDPDSLLTTGALPPSIFGPEDRALGSDVSALLTDLVPEPAGRTARARPPGSGSAVSVATLDLLRFNRVEGASVGARASVATGSGPVEATVRTALLEPEMDAAVRWLPGGAAPSFAVYRRLAPVGTRGDPLGPGNSLSALLLGWDDGEYVRATGVEVVGTVTRRSRALLRWRVFVEHQHPLVTRTSASLPHLWRSERLARPNLPAQRSDQAGLQLELRVLRAPTESGAAAGALFAVDGVLGTGDYLRGRLAGRVSTPRSGTLGATLRAEVGGILGHPTIQGRWLVGGTGGVRGYAPGDATGDTFALLGGEAVVGSRTLAMALFSDAGWAWGDAGPSRTRHHLASAGLGLVALDGVARLDLARGLRPPVTWWLGLTLDLPR